MNYKLKVDTGNIDKVVLKLSQHGEDITIRNVLRSTGIIYIKTQFINEVKLINEIINIEKERFFPQFLFF